MSSGEPPHLRLTGDYGTPPHLQVTGVHGRRRMHAGALLALSLLVILLALVPLLIGPSRSPTVWVTVSADRYGPVHRAGFVGLSIEYPALAAYLGNVPNQIDPVFVNLVRALAPGGSPVLRIGGDSTDHSWWPVPGMTAPAGVSYTLTPTWVAATHALAVATGAKLILGINLAADSTRLAAAEAQALIAGIGRRSVAALEIGNEPDIYADAPWYRSGQRVGYARDRNSWTEARFYSEFSALRQALPAVPLAGPSYAENSWVKQLPEFLAAEPGIGLVTYHRYPLRGCLVHPNPAPRPTIANLLAPAASRGLAAATAPYAAIARAARIPFRVDEINSAACRGKLGVSNTFASALWSLDTLFALAAVGVDGVNIHTLPGAPYEPFTFSQTADGWRGQVRPLYYGMLLFARAFPAGARLLALHVSGNAVRVWATQSPNGRVRVALINVGATAASVRLTLPQPASTLALQRLTAPSLEATSGVSLGGRSFSGSTLTGVLPGPQRAVVRRSRGGYTVRMPPASAALLTS